MKIVLLLIATSNSDAGSESANAQRTYEKISPTGFWPFSIE